MKNLLFPFATLAIVLAGLSSCGLSKISITKRHYRGGFFVHFADNPSSPIAKSKVTTKQGSIKQVSFDDNSKVGSFVNAKPGVVPEKNRSSEEKSSNNYVANASTSELGSPSSLLQARVEEDAKTSFVSSSEAAAGSDHPVTDVPLIVIILCAIFIPPLGVGLMYGIHANFWIDLILTLLFFIPGMIFAIIVVLM